MCRLSNAPRARAPQAPRHNAIAPVENLKARVDELADLMDKFQLSQAELSGAEWRVAFKKRTAVQVSASPATIVHEEPEHVEESHVAPHVPEAPKGTPVSSPMTGIFYTASSPSAPPFIKEGEPVTAGQVVGLIEAMKVFNEIISPTSGRVTKINAANGQIVNPGDVLLYIG